MINILNFYEAGKARSGRVLIPFFDTLNISKWLFSTRHGNAKVKWGDGTEADYVLGKNIDFTSGGVGTSMSHTYATPYTGDVEVIFKQGLSDVYSVNVVDWGNPAQTNKINIQDFGAYIKKFSNLYSYLIETYAYSVTANMPIIKGDLADIPTSVERIKITSFEVLNNTTDVWFNFSSLPAGSKLKFLDLSGDIGTGTNRKILGNLASLPVGCSFCRINKITSNSSITYTAGKVWASSFDTLSIPVSLTTAELDNLLIDMNNSITTKVGAGVIALGGFRIATSDAAVASLQAKGFTVNVNRISDTVLKMPLSANLLDTSSYLNHATMVGTANYTGGALNTSTGNYAYIPNKTSLDIGTGSLYFGCRVKFNAITGSKGIIGKSFAASIIGRYSIYLDSGNILALTQMVAGSTVFNSTSATPYNDGNWHSIECVCDRTTGQQKLYIDGVLINTSTFTPSNNSIAVNGRFTIGAYGNSTASGILASSELNGAIKDVFVHKF